MSMTPTNTTAVIHVMIVDDSAFMRRAIERIILGAGDIEICASVASGESALEKLETLRPDLITMDVEMPGMGGLEAVKAITKRYAIPIIMLSSLTRSGADTTIQALQNGAVDVVAKPSGGAIDISHITKELIEKIHAFAQHLSVSKPSLSPLQSKPNVRRKIVATQSRPVGCVAIAISTGGPAALSVVCKALDASIHVPIIIVQHMPAGFTKPLADRLNAQCALEVLEAEDEMPMKAGRVVLGMAGKQLRVKRSGGRVLVSIAETHGESLYMPSADVLFPSIAEVYGCNAVAIIMTGMGSDGTEGLKKLKKVGGYVYGQDEASCVIYGMPRAAALAGVVDSVLPLGAIADAILAASQGNVV